jgi:hypothetical protein
MKKMNCIEKTFPAFILLIVFVLVLVSCKKSDVINNPKIKDPLISLNYDGNYFDAPTLAAGNYKAAVKFDAARMSSYKNDEIAEMWFYILQKPYTFKISIYESNGGGNPDSLLFRKSVLGTLVENSWNQYVFDKPIKITGKEIWATLEFQTSVEQKIFGCDAGPAANNGDFLWDETDSLWNTYRQRTGESVNWNIRLAIKP